MNYPYIKMFFYKSAWYTMVYINQYSQRSLHHTHVYPHAWWRHYSDNGTRGHEYLWTLKHRKSSAWPCVDRFEHYSYMEYDTLTGSTLKMKGRIRWSSTLTLSGQMMLERIHVGGGLTGTKQNAVLISPSIVSFFTWWRYQIETFSA